MMKRIEITRRRVAAAAFLTIGAGTARAAPSEAQMIGVLDRFLATLNGVDMDALAGMMSERLTYIHANGLVQGKAEQLAMMRNGPLPRYRKLQHRNTVVKMLERRQAVLTGDILFTSLPASGQTSDPRANPYRLTTVWADEDGVWRLVNWQVTGVQASAPAPTR